MKHTILSRLLLCSLSTLATFSYANTSDPLIGKWKTIDQRTGFSLSDVIIEKNKDGSYSARIESLRAVPGATMETHCTKCTGTLKDKPLIGFTPLKNLKLNPTNKTEYINGEYLDPRTGKAYTTKAKLSNHGKVLVIRNTLKNSTTRQNLTWVKY